MTRRLPSAVLARIEAVADVDLWRGEHAIPRDELLVRVVGKQALMCLLTDRVDDEVLQAGRDLKIVANIAVGFDNLDLAAVRRRGVIATNTPDVLTEAVAEFTWGLILAVTRRISEGERLVRRRAWQGWALDFMLGMELRGKQLGLIGMGRIGQAVAARAPAFGMTVACATDEPIAADGGRARLPPMEAMTVDRLLASSDVVSLHVPLTPATRHLIDRTALARMKRTAYLVNTARGPVVDEEALAWALRERLIAGAAIDVYEHEPAIQAALFDLEHVVLAPHLGSATIETRTAMADLAASNVLAVLAGEPPITPIPLP